MAVSVNRKRPDRGGESLLYVGVRSNGRLIPQPMLPDAACRAPDSESILEGFSSLASIDSLALGLVSL